MCGIWDWQSMIVKDLNNSQDPKHTLFCRENASVAIYALFQTVNVPFLHLLPFFLLGFPKSIQYDIIAGSCDSTDAMSCFLSTEFISNYPNITLMQSVTLVKILTQTNIRIYLCQKIYMNECLNKFI